MFISPSLTQRALDSCRRIDTLSLETRQYSSKVACLSRTSSTDNPTDLTFSSSSLKCRRTRPFRLLEFLLFLEHKSPSTVNLKPLRLSHHQISERQIMKTTVQHTERFCSAILNHIPQTQRDVIRYVPVQNPLHAIRPSNLSNLLMD